MDTTYRKIIISKNVIFDEDLDNVQENKNIHEVEDAEEAKDLLFHVDFFKMDPTNQAQPTLNVSPSQSTPFP